MCYMLVKHANVFMSFICMPAGSNLEKKFEVAAQEVLLVPHAITTPRVWKSDVHQAKNHCMRNQQKKSPKLSAGNLHKVQTRYCKYVI